MIQMMPVFRAMVGGELMFRQQVCSSSMSITAESFLPKAENYSTFFYRALLWFLRLPSML